MCADDTCLFCASLTTAYIEAAQPRIAPARRRRTVLSLNPPFLPTFRGVYWEPCLNKWFARHNRVVLGYFEPTEAGHYRAGLAYAREAGAKEPLPRLERQMRGEREARR